MVVASVEVAVLLDGGVAAGSMMPVRVVVDVRPDWSPACAGERVRKMANVV